MITPKLTALGLAALALTACSMTPPAAPPAAVSPPKFTVVEATIPDMQKAMEQGRITSREIVQQYLARIASTRTAERDHHRQPEGARGGGRARPRARRGPDPRPAARHPIALKDNIHTTDMPTTGGALAFEGFVPPYEATLHEEPARRRRDHHREDGADRAGQLGGRRADADARQLQRARRIRYQPVRSAARSARAHESTAARPSRTGGSSSGVGTAANFWAANVGTETSGSILSPREPEHAGGHQADSRAHQPLRRHSDHRRSGHGGADGEDGHGRGDPARRAGRARRPTRTTRRRRTCPPPPNRDYTRFLKRDGLKGARIGIPSRVLLRHGRRLPGDNRAARRPERRRRRRHGGGDRRPEAQGAVIVDPADIPSIVDQDPANNFLVWNICAGLERRKGKDAGCSVVFKYGMKRDFNAWLASLGPSAPVKTLTELRNCNLAHEGAAPSSTARPSSTSPTRWTSSEDRARYEADRAKDIRLGGTHGIDEAIEDASTRCPALPRRDAAPPSPPDPDIRR